jgi:hypothetical protein
MGSFTNQPDFATRAKSITPADEISPSKNLNKAALYIGSVDGESGSGTVVVRMPNYDGELEDFTFKGITAGTFLPICVDYVLEGGTDVGNIIAYW